MQINTQQTDIPAEVANHVLSHFGRGGYPAGDWTESLISLIDRADMANRAKLLNAFPDYGAAVLLMKYDPNGTEYLQKVARCLRCVRCGDADGPFAGAPRKPLCEPCYKRGDQ